MLDPKLLRTEFDRVAANVARRGIELDPAGYEQLEGRRKTLQVQAEELRKQRNTQSKAIGKAKAAGETRL
jgi:seryl-tRNA synthetase